MKNILLFLFCLVLSAQAYGATFGESKVKDYSHNEKEKYLAGAHLMEKNATCDDCHDSATIDDSEYAINAKCVSCHGDLEEVAKTTTGEVNPHKAHLGVINCTSCHAGHESSVLYCQNCHEFKDLSISYNFGAKPKSQKDDLSKYAKIKPVRTENVDILVIGSGATGSVSALTAKEKNPALNIVIIEKIPVAGGNSQLAAGGMNIANSIFQQKLGIKDNEDMMFMDTIKGGKYLNNAMLVRILSSQSDDASIWLYDRGAVMDSPGMGGGASAARMHGPSNGAFAGPYLKDFYMKQIAAKDIDLRLNSKAVKLITDNKGNVTGAYVKGKHSGIYQINAKAVILASGGFGANAEMVAKYRPELLKTPTSNQPGTMGDGIFMGEQVGAATVDVKEIQVNPTLLVGSPVIVSERVRGQGAIFVNKEGKRFISELATRDITSATIFKQTGGSAYMIFDQKVRDEVAQTNAAFELGKGIEANSIKELAGKLNIDESVLSDTINKYNSFVDAGKDTDFNRPNLPAKIDAPKYYAIEIKPAIHYTMGGLKINEKTEVVNKLGDPIKGLFAAGETTGGVHGANRLGGNSMAETVVFGRIAGENAAEYVKANSK